MATFNKEYFAQKKQGLLQKRQAMLQQYVDNAFLFTSAVVEINKELADLELFEKETLSTPEAKPEAPAAQ